MTRFDTIEEVENALKRNPDIHLASIIPAKQIKGLETHYNKPQKDIMVIAEKDFQETIIEVAHTFGWRVAHFRPARVMKNGKETWRTAVSADGKGFPDLLMLKGERCLVVEVKSDTGKLSQEQEDWLKAFVSCHIEIHIWKPENDFDKIVEILK